MEEKLSVCLPVYNGASTILETIKSVLNQTFKDFEFIIVDNASTDNTVDIVRSIIDNRIKLYINEKNLGCGRNLEECKKRATGDIIFYIAADDIADINAIQKVYNAFQISDEIGIATRPYYWFDEDVTKAVRATKQFKETQIVSINNSYEKIKDVIALSDQISGIGFRKKYINCSFGTGCFIETATLVTNMLKNCKAAILKDNIVGIRIADNGSMNPLTYQKSPIMSWYSLIFTVYHEDKFRGLKKYLIDNFIAKNYIGLVQIKNFGGYKFLFREIFYLIRLRWLNIFNFRFWFFTIGTIIIPRFILWRMVVFYKNKINSRFLKDIITIKSGF